MPVAVACTLQARCRRRAADSVTESSGFPPDCADFPAAASTYARCQSNDGRQDSDTLRPSARPQAEHHPDAVHHQPAPPQPRHPGRVPRSAAHRLGPRAPPGRALGLERRGLDVEQRSSSMGSAGRQGAWVGREASTRPLALPAIYRGLTDLGGGRRLGSARHSWRIRREARRCCAFRPASCNLPATSARAPPWSPPRLGGSAPRRGPLGLTPRPGHCGGGPTHHPLGPRRRRLWGGPRPVGEHRPGIARQGPRRPSLGGAPRRGWCTAGGCGEQAASVLAGSTKRATDWRIERAGMGECRGGFGNRCLSFKCHSLVTARFVCSGARLESQKVGHTPKGGDRSVSHPACAALAVRQ